MSCSKNIRGRADKKFCDDYCRNSYNNQLKSFSNSFIRNINNVLKKNRRIIEDFLPKNEETAKIPRQDLLMKGFQFNYLTHTYTNRKGNTYTFCYEYGYLQLEGDWLLLVRLKKPR